MEFCIQSPAPITIFIAHSDTSPDRYKKKRYFLVYHVFLSYIFRGNSRLTSLLYP